ncbi:hypothetical protein CEXT_601901 [Caerostris extrusa]|uniref:Uncharacterized protein n=1 Tax=Caerostris extrusa TaxID=172846 RepID=A0AAV4NHG3_CAEEX|nr:hypothetical protein CEXT_601901 [Caerostris extrusa]
MGEEGRAAAPPFFFLFSCKDFLARREKKFTARMRVSCTSSFSLSLSLGTGWGKITRSSVQRKKRTGSGTRSNFWESLIYGLSLSQTFDCQVQDGLLRQIG